jgi:triacylglycerol esterase/lipase EstA (alpha/beta hydrolase family)
MSKINIRPGLHVVLPDHLNLPEQPELSRRFEARETRRRRGEAAAEPLPPPTDLLVAALQNQDLSLDGQRPVTLPLNSSTPAPAEARREVAPPPEAEARLQVDLAENEEAVVLVERDGLYEWKLPSQTTPLPPPDVRGRKRGATPVIGTTRQAEFMISLVPAPPPERRSAPQGRGRKRDLGTDIFITAAVGILKAYVFKFAARATASGLTSYLESNVQRGLVRIDGEDISTWSRVEDFKKVPLPATDAARILLFIHGTFSSTVGSFGPLAATPGGRAFLKQVVNQYDAVIGFEHSTLSEDPRQNAEDLLRRLCVDSLPPSLTIDIVAYSRGGLVFRYLAEKLLQPAKPRLAIGRTVFVGCTLGGTNLAGAKNWTDLLGFYTNLAAGTARAIRLVPSATAQATSAIVNGTVQSLGGFAKVLAQTAITDRKIPGLAAMEPAGPFLKDLGQSPWPSAGLRPWFAAITSIFDPGGLLKLCEQGQGSDLPRELILRLANGAAAQVIGEESDLVVNTDSMTSPAPAHFQETLAYGKNPQVYHLNYFLQPRTIDALRNWLIQPGSGSPPATRGRKLRSGGGRDAVSSPTIQIHGDGVEAGTLGAKRLRGIRMDTYVAPLGTGFLDLPLPAAARGSKKRPVKKFAVSQNKRDRSTSSGTGPVGGKSAVAEPSIKCEFEAETGKECALNAETSVFVTISREEIESQISQASAKATAMVDPAAKITLQLIGKRNVKPAASAKAELDVDPPQPGCRVQRQFRYIPLELGDGEIWLLAYQHQLPLVTLVLKFKIVTPDAEISGERAIQRVEAQEPSTAQKRVDRLEIIEEQVGGEVVYRYLFDSPTLGRNWMRRSDPIKQDRATYVDQLYQSIEKLWPLDTGQTLEQRLKVFEKKLQAKGAALMDSLVPRDLQEILWQNREKLACIHVISEEPFIPWEILHLKPTDGVFAKGRTWFLGELGLVRWLHNVRQAPEELHIGSERAYYVIPNYTVTRFQLPETDEEKRFLKKEFSATECESTPVAVDALLSGPAAFDLFHFAGHGEAQTSGNAEIILMAEPKPGYDPTAANCPADCETIESDYVEQTAQLSDGKDIRPLVVLNACHAGKLGWSLSKLGGFAQAFLRRDAGLFVAAHWSVGDVSARHFSEAFYAQLKKKATVAEAAKAARKVARETHFDPTWLAYAVYAQPHATLEYSHGTGLSDRKVQPGLMST